MRSHIKFVGCHVGLSVIREREEELEREIVRVGYGCPPYPWQCWDIFLCRCQREADAFHLQWDKFRRRALFFIYLCDLFFLVQSGASQQILCEDLRCALWCCSVCAYRIDIRVVANMCGSVLKNALRVQCGLQRSERAFVVNQVLKKQNICARILTLRPQFYKEWSTGFSG